MKEDLQRKRQRVILEILKEKSVESQSQLMDILQQQGWKCTQATLSRDLKKLKVAKVADREGGYTLLPPGTEVKTEIDDKMVHGFVSIEFSGIFAVIKTLPAFAPSIASAIDSMGAEEIISTISGDDTVLVIPREGFDRRSIRDALSRIIPDLR